MKNFWVKAIVFVVFASGCFCPDCMDNCLQCSGGGCSTCKTSYFVSSGLICQKCSEEGCEVCANNVCSQCGSGFILEGSKCKVTSEGRVYLIVGLIFMIVIVVAVFFILAWKWKAIVAFFKGHQTEVERMKKAEKDGASWFSSVMTNNKILPKSQERHPDDSRAEINIKGGENFSTLGDQRSTLILLRICRISN